MRSRLSRLALWAVCSCVLSSSIAGAQDLLDPAEVEPQGLKLDLLGSGELRSGNVNLALLNVQVLGRYTKDAHEVSLRVTDSFGALGSDRFMNAFRGLAQYRYAVLPNLLDGVGPELILHYDRDEFRRREHLLDLGVGPYVSVVDSDWLRWTVTTAYTFEFEKFAKLTSDRDPTMGVRDSQFELNSHRAWIASDFGWEMAERVHLGESIVFQVPLDHCPCDTRAYSTTFVRVYGNDYAALQTGLTVLYDSRPAINVKSFDAIIRSSLVISL